ncbi:hypothetical protein B4U80_10880, partial [Leptotrombidium deliense]
LILLHYFPNKCLLSSNCEIIKQADESDFVVVGAVTAGSIVDARLVRSGRSVTVIEAGAKPKDFEQHENRFIRKFKLIGNINTLNMAAGKKFGASSTINTMI